MVDHREWGTSVGAVVNYCIEVTCKVGLISLLGMSVLAQQVVVTSKPVCKNMGVITKSALY